MGKKVFSSISMAKLYAGFSAYFRSTVHPAQSRPTESLLVILNVRSLVWIRYWYVFRTRVLVLGPVVFSGDLVGSGFLLLNLLSMFTILDLEV